MANKTLLTIPNLIKAFKKAGFVTKSDLKNFATKDDLKEVLKEYPTKKDVEDLVHNQLTEFHTYITVPEIEKLRIEMRDGFGKVNTKLEEVESDVAEIKRDVHYIKEKQLFHLLFKIINPGDWRWIDSVYYCHVKTYV